MSILEQHQRTTLEEFEAFTQHPDHAERIFEFIAGEIVEVPSNPTASKIASLISGEIYLYLKQHKIGHLTGENGGYQVFGERYAPDVAFISYARQPQLAQSGYNPNPPDLAVEVEFPTSTTSERKLKVKVTNYLAVGTVVWVVYPETQEVEVYHPGAPALVLGINDTLDGGTILSGFQLPVKEIFLFASEISE
ncbi:MAG: Uma2 family endonuclease [Anaerolineae bacterium]|jgi:Uma2 family endonuclease|nr:Uma2 family endonuclease [Anaerolineae bacterium]